MIKTLWHVSSVLEWLYSSKTLGSLKYCTTSSTIYHIIKWASYLVAFHMAQTGRYFISVLQIILAELTVPGIGNVGNYLGQLVRSGTSTLCSTVYRSCGLIKQYLLPAAALSAPVPMSQKFLFPMNSHLSRKTEFPFCSWEFRPVESCKPNIMSLDVFTSMDKNLSTVACLFRSQVV